VYAFDENLVVPVSTTYTWLYFFTWAFMGVVGMQLKRNSEIPGTRVSGSASSTMWEFATGTAVADVDQGNHAYVNGLVLSIVHRRTTFSGWLLN
jgi:hypothetical protein